MQKKESETNRDHISNLLARYKEKLRPPQASVEKEVVAAIKRVTGLTVDLDQVTYTVSTKTIHLQLPSMLRSEIKRKQTEIQTEIKKALSEREVPTLFI